MRFTNLLKYKKREWCFMAKSVQKRGPTLVICEVRAPYHIEKYRKNAVYRCRVLYVFAKERTEAREHRKITGGSPIMSRRDKKRFIRTFQKLRNENPNVTVLDVAKECRVVNVSYRILVRVMNENGYKSLRPRQKGLLSGNNRKRRVRFARNALKQYDPEFWVNNVVHKHSPYNDVLTPREKFGEDPMKVCSTPQRDRRTYMRAAIAP